MESLHRNGSQQRLKLPGARWLERSSAAVLQLRMLELDGRWDEFWARPDITERLTEGFDRARVRTLEEKQAECEAAAA
jgi:hypothetical protein